MSLKFGHIYRSADWKILSPMNRSQIILVAEGVKPGASILWRSAKGYGFSMASLINEAASELALVEMGLTFWLSGINTGQYVFMDIAEPERRRKFFLDVRYAWEEAMDSPEDGFKIYLKFLGNPDCCAEEHVRPTRNIEGRKKFLGAGASISNAWYEAFEMEDEGNPFPPIMEYTSMNFLSCSLDCVRSQELMGRTREVLEVADPEAALIIRTYNKQYRDLLKNLL